jgi:methyl-accepting chemotaxis protein
VLSNRISLAAKLNLAIALPLILAFIASAAAYFAIEHVSRDTRLAIASARIQQDANEFSAVVDRIVRLMSQPGSQQQVAARIDPEITRLRVIAPELAEAMRGIDAGMAERLIEDAKGLDQFVLATMLARGNITESHQMLPSMLGGFAEAAATFTMRLRSLPVDDAAVRAEQFAAQAGRLTQAVLSYAATPDPAGFEATREAVSRFADEIEWGLHAFKAAGVSTRTTAREIESARSKIYGAVMQLGSSSERFEKLQAKLMNVFDHAQAAARVLKVQNETRSSGLLDRISARAELIAIGAMATLAAGLGIAVGVPLFVRRSIANPLMRLEGVMKRLAFGDTAVAIPEVSRSGPIGAMACAVVVFRDSIMEAERLRTEKAQSQANAARQRRDDVHRIAGEFKSAVGSMIDTVSAASTELEAAASSLSEIAETTQMLSVSAAGNFDQASANVRMVAAATDNLSASIVEIARQAEESSRIALDAVQQAKFTDGHIGRLAQSASRIGDVVKLISSIASKTNLLALNAAIEAARAGDAGRGFAVVAQEVKLLASNTAAATEEIAGQVAGMQAATEESVQAIHGINGTIDRIAEIASIILAAVEEQHTATATIARNLKEATRGTSAVAGSIADVSRGATATGQASDAVLSSARSLSGESAKLKREVERFLETVREA